MGQIWGSILDGLSQALSFLHDQVEGIFGVHSWGWAIILLTIGVRVLLLPLAIKQTRSMRAMQTLQPKIKEIQKKYKADRELLRKDPEQYKAKRQKMNEEMTALYREEGVNPAGGCLPLLLQAPIFFALFRVLQSFEPLREAPFYFFTPNGNALEGAASGLGATVREAGIPGYLLIVLMAATMFWSQRQMMARTAANADPAQMQQQKIMLYVMPVFLAVISLNFPMGVLLYWVTTNFWQVGQQAVILHEVAVDAPAGSGPPANGAAKTSKTEPKPSTSKKPAAGGSSTSPPTPKKSTGGGASSGSRAKRKREHLPPPRRKKS